MCLVYLSWNKLKDDLNHRDLCLYHATGGDFKIWRNSEGWCEQFSFRVHVGALHTENILVPGTQQFTPFPSLEYSHGKMNIFKLQEKGTNLFLLNILSNL